MQNVLQAYLLLPTYMPECEPCDLLDILGTFLAHFSRSHPGVLALMKLYHAPNGSPINNFSKLGIDVSDNRTLDFPINGSRIS